MLPAFLATRICYLLVILATASPRATGGAGGSPASKLARISVLGSKRYGAAVLVRASGLKPGAPVTAKNFKDDAAAVPRSKARFDDHAWYIPPHRLDLPSRVI